MTHQPLLHCATLYHQRYTLTGFDLHSQQHAKDYFEFAYVHLLFYFETKRDIFTTL